MFITFQGRTLIKLISSETIFFKNAGLLSFCVRSRYTFQMRKNIHAVKTNSYLVILSIYITDVEN